MIIHYFTSGTCKAFQGDWLLYTDTLWTQVQGHYRTTLAATLLQIVPKNAWAVGMYSALAFELLAPLLFTVRRLRPIGILWGIAMHLGINLLMHNLVFFSSQMMCFYLLFLTERQYRWLDHKWSALRVGRTTT